MKTPAGPADPSPTLYGCVAPGINRRLVVTGGLLLPFAARAGTLYAPKVKALAWTGTAEVAAPDGNLLLDISTRVEAFVRARSQSNISGKPETARTLIVEPDGAWVERGGTRQPLPARQAAHERAQYGLYGYLLRQLSEPGAHFEQPGFPAMDFTIDPDNRPLRARYIVPSHENDGLIIQRVIFGGLAHDKDVEWPRQIAIWPAGAQSFNFRLNIETFTVELA